MRLTNLTRLAALFLTCTVWATAFAKPVNTQALQKLADDYVAAHHDDEYVSALSLSIWMPDAKSPINIYAGSKSRESVLPVTQDTQFQIGSITKSFITAIVLQMEGEQQYHFTINDPIEKFFPEYSKWQGVTIRQLMNMTSGIPSYTNEDAFVIDYLNHPYHDLSPTELINVVAQKPLLFKPGTQWDYSNTNYILLGMLIEKLSGHTLTDEINHRLISPLHLTHTIYAPYNPTEVMLKNLVNGYSFRRSDNSNGMPLGLDVTLYSLSWAGAAGAIVANAEDIAKWAKALYTPGVVLNDTQWKKLTELVSIRTAQPLPKPTENDPAGFGMGIGFGLFPVINKYVYTYEGMTLAGRGFYLAEPTTGIVIAGTLNSSLEVKDDHYTELLAAAYQLVTQERPSV